MKRRRLELPRSNFHYPLKVARLPIPPPLQHIQKSILDKPCPEQDSNLHAVKHTHLKRARLPIPPPGQQLVLFRMWSGKRDSNSRPQPWQGCALPTELFPHLVLPRHFSKCAAKVLCFFETTNYFLTFFVYHQKIAICPIRLYSFF